MSPRIPHGHRRDPDDYGRAASWQYDWVYQQQIYRLTHYGYSSGGYGLGYTMDWQAPAAAAVFGGFMWGIAGLFRMSPAGAFAAASHSCDTGHPDAPPQHDPTKDKPGDHPHSDGGSATTGTMNGLENGQTNVGSPLGLQNPFPFNGMDTGYIPVGVLAPELAVGSNPGPRNGEGNPIDCRAARPSDAVSDGSTGWIRYGSKNPGTEAATMIEACLTGEPAGSRGSSADPNSAPPGFREAQRYASTFSFPPNPISRCHLAAREHGGAGTGEHADQNLVPCFQRSTNAGPLNSMREFEHSVSDAMREGQAVHEIVSAYYQNPGTDTIPVLMWMSAVGTYPNGAMGMNEHQPIWNHALDGNGVLVDLCMQILKEWK